MDCCQADSSTFGGVGAAADKKHGSVIDFHESCRRTAHFILLSTAMGAFTIIPKIWPLLVPLVCCQLVRNHYIDTFEIALKLSNNTLVAATNHYLFAYDLESNVSPLAPTFAARIPLDVTGDDGNRELRTAANSSVLLCGISFCKLVTLCL